MKLLKLTPCFIVALYVCSSQAKEKELFGVAASDGKVACATFLNLKTSPPKFLTIIFPDSSKKLVTTIESKLAEPCAALALHDLPGPFFSLQGNLNSQLEDGIGIVTVKNTNLNFRSCTSQEGIWLSAWKGQPLNGRRIWNQYVYLGYDVEPNCDNKDYDKQ